MRGEEHVLHLCHLHHSHCLASEKGFQFSSCQKAGECRQWLVGVDVYSNQLCNCNHQQGLGRVTALQSTADLRRAQVKVAPSQALSFSAGGSTTVSSFLVISLDEIQLREAQVKMALVQVLSSLFCSELNRWW